MNNCAFNKGHSCIALREKDCVGCAFYKTREQLVEGRHRAMDRINALPKTKKYYIIHKYYKQWRKSSFDQS